MAGFKDQIAEDLDTFVNLDEFAEEHVIDGRTLSIVVDKDQLKKRTQAEYGSEYDGISIGEILYYVKAEEFGERPEEGTPQIYDGRQMYVVASREDTGVYEIILGQNRGY